MLLQEFKDTNILYSDGKKNHFHLKTEVTDSYNPKLQHIIRKASIRKAEGQEFNTIEKDCDIESSVKSVQIVQLSKLKKSNSRQKETRIRENSELRSIPESSKNFITMHSNNMLPPVPAYSALGDRSSSYEPASNAPKIRAHQSIKNKIKKHDNCKDYIRHSEAQSLLNNFRVMAANSGNRLEFISRSKKMLA